MAKNSVINLKKIFNRSKPVASTKPPSKTEKTTAKVFIYLDKKSLEADKSNFKTLPAWQRSAMTSAPLTWHRFAAKEGPQFFCWLEGKPSDALSNEKSLQTPLSVKVRDLCGPLFAEFEKLKITDVNVSWSKAAPQLEKAFTLGIELAAYRYIRAGAIRAPQFNGGHVNGSQRAGESLAQATNLARHLVNLPGNLLHPVSYAAAVQDLFEAERSVKVEVWDEKKLQAERMHLLLAVGRGAEFGPRLVHIRYRPKSSKEKQPWAFVGKGVTFDSGGLDIKPPAPMRWMKKDMGGSAAIVGFAWWCVQTKVPQAMDFYLPLAENAVAAKSFRPGDIITSRSGLNIEIHNTDAEGRLVLADALDVAATQQAKDLPSLIIDMATLTGAIKVGLGSQLAGLFSNDVSLREQLFKSSSKAGDLTWPMPLYQEYRQSMMSPVSAMTNAVDGFGGAITAALFLESFVKQIPWAHVDIYAWKDAPSGAYLEPGGSGQGVQLLSQWVTDRLKLKN